MTIYQLTTTQGSIRYYYVRAVADLFRSRLGGEILEIPGASIDQRESADYNMLG